MRIDDIARNEVTKNGIKNILTGLGIKFEKWYMTAAACCRDGNATSALLI